MLPDWASLAVSGATIAVYMGRTVAASVAERLMTAGSGARDEQIRRGVDADHFQEGAARFFSGGGQVRGPFVSGLKNFLSGTLKEKALCLGAGPALG